MNDDHPHRHDGLKSEEASLHGFSLDVSMRSSPTLIYEAWTRRFDSWFATPGMIEMEPVIGRPFWFATLHEGTHHPHYGRFLRLEHNRVVEMTWVTGMDGTDGAETVVRVELTALGAGAQLHLVHSGFYDERATHRHRAAWPTILAALDEKLSPSIN